MTKPTTQFTVDILHILDVDGPISCSEVAGILGFPRVKVTAAIYNLEKRGAVSRTGKLDGNDRILWEIHRDMPQRYRDILENEVPRTPLAVCILDALAERGPMDTHNVAKIVHVTDSLAYTALWVLRSRRLVDYKPSSKGWVWSVGP